MANHNNSQFQYWQNITESVEDELRFGLSDSGGLTAVKLGQIVVQIKLIGVDKF